MSLVISPDAFEAMTRHASAAYPDECCGAMIEIDGEIGDALPLTNVTQEEARRRFVVGPKDYLAAERRASELGGTLAGFYHSHPDHPARPSQADLEAAWPNLTYVIISVSAGVPGATTGWRLRDDRSAFEPQNLLWPTRS
jgi:proteasome lid subunit RPN8/RPN11